MVKIEHANTLLPQEAASVLDVPPGFPPLTFAAVESSGNQNPAPNENVPQVHEQCLNPEFTAGQSPRRTSRKRSRPKFYKPPTPRQPEDTLGSPAACPRRRGRPPKAQPMSPFSGQETQTKNGSEVSSVSSLQMTKEQSSSQANNHVVLSQFFTPVQMTKEQSCSQSNKKVGPKASPWWPTVPPRQRGRLPKGRRGRPPKVRLSQLSCHEAQTRNGNEVSSVKSVHMTKEQSSSQANEQIFLAPLACQEAQTRNGNEVSSVTSAQMSREQSSSQANDHVFLAPLGKNQARNIDNTLIDENIAHTLEAINKKHGDILRDCSLESDCMRTLVLIGICKVVHELQQKRLEDFEDASSLAAYYTAVRDGENMKVDVQWLHNRLDEIKYAVSLSNEAKGAVHEKNRLVEEIEKKKEVVERLQSEIQNVREQLARDVMAVMELHNKFGDHMTAISRFEQKGLMDGLL